MVEDINVVLFHATKRDDLSSIIREGIKPGNSEKHDYRQRFEDLLEVIVKGTVSSEYIIACLEIVEMEPIQYKPIKCI